MEDDLTVDTRMSGDDDEHVRVLMQVFIFGQLELDGRQAAVVRTFAQERNSLIRLRALFDEVVKAAVRIVEKVLVLGAPFMAVRHASRNTKGLKLQNVRHRRETKGSDYPTRYPSLPV
jgi:hypothetical protein